MKKSGEPAKSSAARMRRHRERVRSGGIFVRFEMTPAAINQIIALGWLKPEQRTSPVAVTEAFLQFGTQALWPHP